MAVYYDILPPQIHSRYIKFDMSINNNMDHNIDFMKMLTQF